MAKYCVRVFFASPKISKTYARMIEERASAGVIKLAKDPSRRMKVLASCVTRLRKGKGNKQG